MHVGKVLSETAKRIPQKTAVIFKDEEITFSQLELMATRLANKLRSCKVGSGQKTWSNGVMEYWSNGVMERSENRCLQGFPQYSNTPTLHKSH